MRSPSHSLRFLAFNPRFSTLNDPAIHQAFACVIAQEGLVSQLNGQAAPLESFVLPAEIQWSNPDTALPCKGADGAARIEQAVQILKSAGYTWKKEPAANAAGSGLTLPNGEAFPNVTLIVSSEDDVRVAAAAYVQQQAQKLGIPLSARAISSIDLNYAVLGSQSYEMALLGWHVSSYPGYLCDWFGEGNQFQYAETQIMSLCGNLQGTSNLDNARQQVFKIQSILVQELPFIPLYSGVTFDAYRNIKYPFDQVLDGLSGVFGAPELAIPVNQ
jgi:ABC-type transport system substrate-binding protein